MKHKDYHILIERNNVLRLLTERIAKEELGFVLKEGKKSVCLVDTEFGLEPAFYLKDFKTPSENRTIENNEFVKTKLCKECYRRVKNATLSNTKHHTHHKKNIVCCVACDFKDKITTVFDLKTDEHGEYLEYDFSLNRTDFQSEDTIILEQIKNNRIELKKGKEKRNSYNPIDKKFENETMILSVFVNDTENNIRQVISHKLKLKDVLFLKNLKKEKQLLDMKKIWLRPKLTHVEISDGYVKIKIKIIVHKEEFDDFHNNKILNFVLTEKEIRNFFVEYTDEEIKKLDPISLRKLIREKLIEKKQFKLHLQDTQ